MNFEAWYGVTLVNPVCSYGCWVYRKKRLDTGVLAARCHFHGSLFFQVSIYSFESDVTYSSACLCRLKILWQVGNECHGCRLLANALYTAKHHCLYKFLLLVVLQLRDTLNITSMNTPEK